jgi:hypothetical protein
MLRISHNFPYFLLKVLDLDSQLLFLFAELVTGLSQAIDHDVTGDIQKELQDVIFTGQVNVLVDKSVKSVDDGSHPFKFFLFLSLLTLFVAKFITFIKIFFLPAQLIPQLIK